MATLEGGELIPLDRVLKAANGLANAARNVAKEYTPIGWTGQLAASVQAEPAEINGDVVTITLTAGARSADGEEYAEKQHDVPLRHVYAEGSKPNVGYQAFGNPGEPSDDDRRGPAERKYWAGYHEMKGQSQRFAARFLERGAEEAIDEFADAFFSEALSG